MSFFNDFSRFHREVDHLFRKFDEDFVSHQPLLIAASGSTKDIIPRQNAEVGTFSVDVKESEDKFLVHCDLPGFKKEDMKIEVHDGLLTISGDRKSEHKEDVDDPKKKIKFHRLERSFGSVCRRMAIPKDVDVAKVEAKLNDGVLEVVLPRIPATKSTPLSITIQ
jgi:HSP20 family protein